MSHSYLIKYVKRPLFSYKVFANTVNHYTNKRKLMLEMILLVKMNCSVMKSISDSTNIVLNTD